MSDLTPPRSQQNTPVRPGETPAQSSPSASRAPRPPQGTGRFEPSAYRGLETLPDRRQPFAGGRSQGNQENDDDDEPEDEEEDGLDTDDDEDERLIMMHEDEEDLVPLADDDEEDEDENMDKAPAGQPGQGDPSTAAALQKGEGSSTTPVC